MKYLCSSDSGATPKRPPTTRSRQAQVLLMAVLTTLLASCGGGGGGGDGSGSGPASATLTADFYPLATGDRRSWSITLGDGVVYVRSERLGAPSVLGGRQAYPLRDADGNTEYLAQSATAISSVPGPGSDVLSVAAGPVDLVRFGLTVGQTATLFDRVINVDIDGDGSGETVALTVQSTFVGLETVDTAAGRFVGAAHVRTALRSTVRSAGGIVQTVDQASDEWFAPGVGPVRTVTRTVTNGGPPQTAAEEVFAYGVGSNRSESVAPALVSGSPAPDAAVLPGTTITLNFSEPLDPLSLGGSNGVTLVNGTGQAVAATRNLSQDGREFTLVPQAAMPDGRYEVRIGNGVTDLANNPMPAVVRAFTVDTQGPQLVASTPANGADDVPLTGTLTFTYNEPVFAPEGSFPQFALLDTSRGTTTYLPATLQGRNVAVTLATPLQRSGSYLLSLNFVLVDAGGNPVGFVDSRVGFRTDPGPLARPTTLEDGAAVYAVTQGDINGDGRIDLVYAGQRVGSSDYYVAARLQQPDGSHAPATRLASLAPAGICDPRQLSVADVDGDGRADIALTGCGGVGSNLVVLRQTTAGGFVAEAPTATSTGFHIANADVDGDGRKEFAAVVYAGGSAQLNFIRRGTSGTWVSVLAFDLGSVGVGDFAMADLDGDGRRDLQWLRPLPDNINWELAWAPRQGAGFGTVRTLPLPSGLDRAPTFSVGDFNGDGRADVLLLLQSIPPGSGSASSEMQVLRNDGAGGLVLAQTVALSSGAAAASVGDVDGDGRSDVVIAHSVLQQTGVVLQGTDGKLQAEKLFEGGYGYFDGVDALLLVDLNGDGLRDIVVTNTVLLGRATSTPWSSVAAGRVATAAASTQRSAKQSIRPTAESVRRALRL